MSDGVEDEERGDAAGDLTGSPRARRASMQKLVELLLTVTLMLVQMCD